MRLLPLVEAPAEPKPRRLPSWLKRALPRGNENFFTHNLLRELRLETVCENARCPNRPECYARRTATFMILGNVCTRPCGFCSVPRGEPEALEDDEPERVAEAAAPAGLTHVVITSVTRDDLPDGGADHFYRCVLAVRARTGAVVEVLTPDFLGDRTRHRSRPGSRPGGLQPQHGDGAALLQEGARPGRLSAQPRPVGITSNGRSPGDRRPRAA